MTEEDAELVALIDGELDDQRKARLLARLAENGALRQRYEALRWVGAPIFAGLSALAEQAPLERLAAALPGAGPAPSPRRPSLAWRELAAGVAIGLLIAGAAAFLARSPHPSGEEDWRAAIVEYAELYNTDTFARANPDATQKAEQLRVLDRNLGIALDPEKLTLPGLQYRSAVVFTFEGKPLGQIAFTDQTGEPVLFCIASGAERNAPKSTETRGELALTSWSRGAHDFMVVGRVPEARVADLAATLAARF